MLVKCFKLQLAIAFADGKSRSRYKADFCEVEQTILSNSGKRIVKSLEKETLHLERSFTGQLKS